MFAPGTRTQSPADPRPATSIDSTRSASSRVRQRVARRDQGGAGAPAAQVSERIRGLHRAIPGTTVTGTADRRRTGGRRSRARRGARRPGPDSGISWSTSTQVDCCVVAEEADAHDPRARRRVAAVRSRAQVLRPDQDATWPCGPPGGTATLPSAHDAMSPVTVAASHDGRRRTRRPPESTGER